MTYSPTFTRLLCGAALCAALAACSGRPPVSDSPARDAAAVYSEVASANKLIVAQMSISKTAIVDDLRLSEAHGLRQTAEALLDKAKIGSRKAVYSYNTYMRAFIPMAELTPDDVSVDERAGTITLTLPAIRTEIIGRDATLREDHYRVTGLRHAIDPDERARMKDQMGASLRLEVEANPTFRAKLLETAREKATAYFSTLLSDGGKYTVIIKFRQNS